MTALRLAQIELDMHSDHTLLLNISQVHAAVNSNAVDTIGIQTPKKPLEIVFTSFILNELTVLVDEIASKNI